LYAYRNIFNHQQREEADAQVHLERFNDLIEVLENYGVNIGNDTVLYKHDKLFAA